MSDERREQVVKENQRLEIGKEGYPTDTGENVPGYVKNESPQEAAQRVENERHKTY